MIQIKNTTGVPQLVYCISETKKIKRDGVMTIDESILWRGEVERLKSIMKVSIIEEKIAPPSRRSPSVVLPANDKEVSNG